MSNLIQVKRSTTNAAPAAGGLQVGELAYSLLSTSNSLFVGDGSNNPIRVGGGNYLYLHQANTSNPGTLTANAVVLVDGNSFINAWKTNTLTVGVDGETVSITNVSTFANTIQLGASAGGANTELASTWAIKTFVDGKVAAAIPILSNSFVGVGNTSNYLGGTAGFTFDSTSNTLSIGNTTVNAQISGSSIVTGATLAAGNTTLTGFLTVTSTANVAALNVSGLTATGNATVTGFINASSYGRFAGVVNASSFNSTGATTSTFANNVTVTGVANVSSLNVSGVVAEGNTTVTGFVNVSSYGRFAGAVNAASLNISGLTAAGNTTITGFVNVSTYGTFGGTVNAAALNVSGVVAEGNTTVTGFINASSYGTFGAQVNATSFNSTGATTSTFANNVTVTGTANVITLNVSGDATISGNLYVSGNLVSINVSTLAISDSLIQLATNNNITPDVLDIGMYGNYGIDANTNNHRHTGFFRDASDGVWKLFNGLLAAPTTTVDTANATYAIATMQSYLSTGGATATGLIANATTISITANSTLNVAIVANTLTLSSALGGTSGGTGLASFTAEDILVANSSNGFRKLAAGTEGYVLQISSGVVAYNTLDGGSF